MLYWLGPGLVLHDWPLPYGGAHKPWKKLSGVRFSCTTTMMCWNFGGWPVRGTTARQTNTATIVATHFMLLLLQSLSRCCTATRRALFAWALRRWPYFGVKLQRR